MFHFSRLGPFLPWVGAALGLAVFALYPLVEVGFIGDDLSALHRLVLPISWAETIRRVPDFYHYYPVTLVFWKAQNATLGLSPSAWHMVSIALYLIAVVLSAALLRRILRSDLAAGMAAVLFASFYANYEPVAFLVTSNFILALDLLLGALLLYRPGPDPQPAARYVASVLFGAAAILTFEPALVFLPAIVLLEYGEGGVRGAWDRWRRYVVPWGVGGLYIGSWFLGAGTILESGPSVLGVVKKALTGMVYFSAFNVTPLLDLYFGGSKALRVVATLALAMVWMIALVRGGRRVRILVLWAALALVPTLILQGHKPRYFLFSSVPLAALWSLALLRVEGWVRTRGGPSWKAGGRGIAVVLVVASAACGVAFQRDRVAEWGRASEVLEAFRAASTEVMTVRPGVNGVAIVDAPAMSGPYHDVRWPAYLFLSAFNRGSIFVLTPPHVVPSPVHLWRTGALDPLSPVVSTDSISEAGLRDFIQEGGVVFRFGPDQSIRVMEGG